MGVRYLAAREVAPDSRGARPTGPDTCPAACCLAVTVLRLMRCYLRASDRPVAAVRLVGGYRENMRRRRTWIQANVVGFAPPVRLAGQLVGHRETRADINAERGSVQPEGRLTRLVRVKIHNDENRIAAGTARRRRARSLREAQNIWPVWKMEAEVPNLP